MQKAGRMAAPILQVRYPNVLQNGFEGPVDLVPDELGEDFSTRAETPPGSCLRNEQCRSESFTVRAKRSPLLAGRNRGSTSLWNGFANSAKPERGKLRVPAGATF